LEPKKNKIKNSLPIYSSENLTKNNVVCSQLFTFRVPQKNPSAAPVARATDLSLARHLTASHMQISPVLKRHWLSLPHLFPVKAHHMAALPLTFLACR